MTVGTEPERENAGDLRARVEDFLYQEAALLDAWQLDEWLELFSPDGRYVVPATDFRHGDGTNSLVILDDDMVRLKARVTRLKSKRAYRESPRSRTRRLVTNVRVVASEGERIDVVANFCVYRIRRETSAYIGQYFYRLARRGDSYAIVTRRVELDLETLRPFGTVSFIL